MATAVVAGLFQTSCLKENAPGTYFTFSGYTIRTCLSDKEGYKGDFTKFLHILDRADMTGELETYGEHTCFAPTNDAVDEYLEEKGLTMDSLDLPKYKSLCDTIAKTHLCIATFFCKDFVDGPLPAPNLMDRYLVYSTDSSIVDGKYTVIYRINKTSTLIHRDDTVQNGVVHVIDHVIRPSNRYLPPLMAQDSTISAFVDAINATKLSERLSDYMDPYYPTPDYDSTYLCFQSMNYKNDHGYDTGYETDYPIWPEQRKFLFTVFAPQNDVLAARCGVSVEDLTLKDLRIFANSVYGDEGFEGDFNNNTDTMMTKEKNSLYKFVAYHILPEQLEYAKMNLLDDHYVKTGMVKWDELDIEDFFETLMPHSLMRISTPKSDQKYRYINRKGTVKTGLEYPGIKVIETPGFDEQPLNGTYYYVSDVLLYDQQTREGVLNTRMRIFCNTMSPDFVNSNARGRSGAVKSLRYVVGFKKGYCQNVAYSDQTRFFVRYYDTSFTSFMGNELSIMGIFDVAFKLPPVPFDGTYEIRMFIETMASTKADRGVIQVYFLDGNVEGSNLNNIGKGQEWKPCGIPVDMTIIGDDPRIGNFSDDDISSKGLDIDVINKAMRNRGYMRAMDSYKTSNGDVMDGSVDRYRKILTTEYMQANHDYWIRVRATGSSNDKTVCPWNVIEVVPKSVYAGEIPEDRH